MGELGLGVQAGGDAAHNGLELQHVSCGCRRRMVYSKKGDKNACDKLQLQSSMDANSQ